MDVTLGRDGPGTSCPMTRMNARVADLAERMEQVELEVAELHSSGRTGASDAGRSKPSWRKELENALARRVACMVKQRMEDWQAEIVSWLEGALTDVEGAMVRALDVGREATSGRSSQARIIPPSEVDVRAAQMQELQSGRLQTSGGSGGQLEGLLAQLQQMQKQYDHVRQTSAGMCQLDPPLRGELEGVAAAQVAGLRDLQGRLEALHRNGSQLEPPIAEEPTGASAATAAPRPVVVPRLPLGQDGEPPCQQPQQRALRQQQQQQLLLPQKGLCPAAPHTRRTPEPLSTRSPRSSLPPAPLKGRPARPRSMSPCHKPASPISCIRENTRESAAALPRVPEVPSWMHPAPCPGDPRALRPCSSANVMQTIAAASADMKGDPAQCFGWMQVPRPLGASGIRVRMNPLQGSPLPMHRSPESCRGVPVAPRPEGFPTGFQTGCAMPRGSLSART